MPLRAFLLALLVVHSVDALRKQHKKTRDKHIPGVAVEPSLAQEKAEEQLHDDTMRHDDNSQACKCVDCPEYVRLSAKDKQKVIWEKIISDEYTGGFPTNWPSFTGRVNEQRKMASNGTMPMFFDRFSDENKAQHAKVIHTFGSVANVRFEPVANGWDLTGMFKEGAEHAIVRLSVVADWTKACKGGTDGNFKGCFKPSMALKMLRSADFSSNLVAQVNLGDGVGQHFNWFSHIQGTWLPTPAGLGAALIKFLFSYASEKSEIGGVGLEELASAGSNANQDPSEIMAPSMLYFVPDDGIRDTFSDEEHDVREDFKKIAVGTVLYNIVAVSNHPACFVNDPDPVLYTDLSQSGCPHTTVGRMVTTSRFVASAYGDHRLFFQHERLKTKDGTWKRQACVSTGGNLPDTNGYRMANDWSMTCSQKCGDPDMTPVDAPCPFAKLR